MEVPMQEHELFSITQLKSLAAQSRVEARVHGQVESIQQKTTQAQKPYYEVGLTDASARMTLRAWSDSPAFPQCQQLQRGHFIEVEGEFSQNGSFGLDAKRWTCRALSDNEREALLCGPSEIREKQQRDFDFIVETVATVADPRLRMLSEGFLAEFGPRFRRTAAARNYHHARRGGLVEHTAQMMRAVLALSGVYPELNRDLLVAGVLFHDCGKLWENAIPEGGFSMPFDELGEMLGHISIGVELVNGLWRKLPLEQWAALEPASEDVRRHLLHLIASHHGEMQFGSPVVPKTPEAWALHHIDNLDAKMEMMAAGYRSSTPLAARIFDRVRPLPGNLVQPLAAWDPTQISGDAKAAEEAP